MSCGPPTQEGKHAAVISTTHQGRSTRKTARKHPRKNVVLEIKKPRGLHKSVAAVSEVSKATGGVIWYHLWPISTRISSGPINHTF